MSGSPRKTAQTDYGELRRLAIKHVRDAFGSQTAIDGQWQDLGYTARPDLAAAIAEYDQFTELLVARGVTLELLPAEDGLGLDSLYVRDAAVLCDRGVVLCRMGKIARRGEPRALGTFCEHLGLPVLGAIETPGMLEGGDVAWLDPRTIAVGQGYRTNGAGIEQLRVLLADSVDELIVVPLPHHRGPSDVFHLMSIMSPLAPDLALVYSPLMPVPFRQTLLDRGIGLVEVPEEELDSLGCNSLVLGPRTCLLARGNPRTRGRLERAGVEVIEFSGAEIALKGGGGPTCLTRPLEWLL
ncbi:MAG: arginine deiminase family protein [Acidobacteria bacterium]|nr:arginine deiminase family protein [Acidobacteriota bacterium]